jgi:hypothetical protein
MHHLRLHGILLRHRDNFRRTLTLEVFLYITDQQYCNNVLILVTKL